MWKCSMGMVVLLALSSVSPAAQIIIDSFEYGNPNLSNDLAAPPVRTSTVTETGLSQVIGGVRKTTNSKLQGPDGQVVSAKIMDPYGPPVDKVLGLSTDTGGLIGQWTVEYGLAVGGTAPGNLGGLMGSYTNDAIIFRFESADAGASVAMTADDGTHSFTITKLTTGPGSLMFDFADYPGVDFGSIDNLKFEITGKVDGDYQISLLETNTREVPEPITLAAVILGAGALGGYVRRRRAAC
jgi:hypothetical protein